MGNEYFAHISPAREPETLIDHLRLTGKLAALNGSSFNHGKVCEQLGLLHDIGKHTANFQKVLQHKAVKQDHAIAAAIYYLNYAGVSDKWMREHMSLIMACHHSYLYSDGLCFCNKEFSERRFETVCGMAQTTKDSGKSIAVGDLTEWNGIKSYIDDNKLLLDITADDYFNVKNMSLNERMFYARMLYSCLVDADYSATAEYSEPGFLAEHFYTEPFDAAGFSAKLETYHNKLTASAFDTAMNRLRDRVYARCAAMGEQVSSFATLTAPTGTGKTLALMRFALNNALAFGRQRIIVVLPYLSIINQNAGVYRQIFGDDAVLVDDCQTEYTESVEVMADRWSSPIIVTTSVKFFETLFSCKATDCRRLHSVADSVVVFDECQTLSSDVLNSSIEVLQSLTKYYNTTVLFSTATQPSYEYRNCKERIRVGNFAGVGCSMIVSDMEWDAVEVMDDVQGIFDEYAQARSLSVLYRTDDIGYGQLADYYEKSAALYVFNTVKHAKHMYEELVSRYGSADCYLITSNLCAADKLAIIDIINARLATGDIIKVASTQCIEAGVDFDFPAGAREFAPLDSVIQTAGRINRNGFSDGKFLVFAGTEHGRFDYPSVGYKCASGFTKTMAAEHGGLCLYDTGYVDAYFAKLYRSSNYSRDLDDLYKAEARDDYKGVKDSYKLIEDRGQVMMIVRPAWCNADAYESLVNDIKLHDYTITKGLMKKLMPFTVSAYCSKSFDLSAVSTQLRFRGHDFATNWYLLINDSSYTKIGFDKSVSGDGFIF